MPVIAPVAPKKKHGWLPLLTVLFLFSYGLMTMLIVEQGSTIESQRALIRELFRDSTELTATKMKAQQERMKAGAAHGKSSPGAQTPPSSQKQATQAPLTQAPSTQAPSTQAQQTPSQAAPKHSRSQAEKEKQQYRTPPRPATDQADDARALVTI